ncbi:MAG: HAMP domain-containing protein [Acidobacteria bacterium]|nr:HAMP domain-containing protein [Acidobacteriota bacterium]
MRLGIRGKQIAGVTAIVGVAVVALSGLYVTRLAGVVLHESYARGQLLSNAIFHRAREVVTGSPEPYAALRADPGLRAILESTIYGESVTGASILDTLGTVVASSDTTRVGLSLDDRADLAALLEQSPVQQLRVIYSEEGRTLEVRQPMTLGDEAFGSIRIGVSTLLMRQELNASLRPALVTAAVAVGVAVFVAALLAQLLLRPIHVIRSGLTRLGKGEVGVTLDLPPDDEFGELGAFFNTVSQQLSADRDALAGQKARLQSAVEHLEDAVALFNPSGELLFSNPSMRPALAAEAIGRPIHALLPDAHPYRTIVEETLATRKSHGPVQVRLDDEVLLMTHAIEATDHGLVGVLLVSRNLAYLSRVQSTIAYSRKLVALGRLTAGIAHEVKNPLNAMIIHLELLRTKIRGGALAAAPQPEPVAVSGAIIGLAHAGREAAVAPAVQGALEHVEIIEGEIRRLDEVVQGFLKFTRPEDLRLQPVSLKTLFEEILPVIEPEARANSVRVVVDAPGALPTVNGDAAMLRQAFLNLAINACQAMPNGGTLRLVCAPAPHNSVEARIEDTGIGIRPEHLGKIFDLYYTTKDHGTGIGLSMVYRIVQMHDGEIEVQSTPGSGTTFRILLPRANET